MNRTRLVAIVLCLGLAACSWSEEEPTAGAPAEQAAPPAANAPDGAADELSKVFDASQRAFAAAKKACTGCPNPTACEEALTTALRLTTAALQSTTEGKGKDFADLEKKTKALTEQFDGLAELADECAAAVDAG